MMVGYKVICAPDEKEIEPWSLRFDSADTCLPRVTTRVLNGHVRAHKPDS